MFKRERNLALGRAVKIKQQALGALHAAAAVNTFQWCKALLTAECSASLAVVQRFEADSKFFRCFAAVLVLLLIAWPWHQQWPLIGIPILLVLFLLAFWRYMEQRYKAINQAYWSIITLTARKGTIAIDKPTPDAASPTHAGGVVFRPLNGAVQYLLVEATNSATQWVLPKGHVEEGEQHRDTAVREVYEETGVWARIVGHLSDATWSANGTAITTRFFLMQAVGRGWRQDKDRRHEWLELPDAIAKASHIETRELLQAAEQQRART